MVSKLSCIPKLTGKWGDLNETQWWSKVNLLYTCRGDVSFTRGFGIPMMALNNGSMFSAIASGSSPAIPWIAEVYTICDEDNRRMQERKRTGIIYFSTKFHNQKVYTQSCFGLAFAMFLGTVARLMLLVKGKNGTKKATSPAAYPIAYRAGGVVFCPAAVACASNYDEQLKSVFWA